jgi:hypothetical protein
MFSNNRFTPAARRSRIAQVEELINAARVSVFFIDDLQVVRPGEIGSSSLIRDAAEAQGVPLYEFELDAQFRCNGSEAFILPCCIGEGPPLKPDVEGARAAGPEQISFGEPRPELCSGASR